MGIFGLFFLLPAFSSGGGSTGGAFAILWNFVAFGAAAYHGYNALSSRGTSLVDIDGPPPPSSSTASGQVGHPDFDERMRKLDSLHRDGTITDGEYQEKRAGILADRW